MIFGLLFVIFSLFCLLHSAVSLVEPPGYINTDNADTDIYQLLNSKDYIPNEKDLPKPTIIKKDDNDATYILSKLSDEELIKLLSEKPTKNEYDMNDLLELTGNARETSVPQAYERPKDEDNQKAVFRLEEKEVEPFNFKTNADPKFNAYQKLNNLLYSRPQLQGSDEDNDKNEMLFDVLVAQLKSLCCKKSKPKANTVTKLKSLLKQVMAQKKSKYATKTIAPKENLVEHIFLVINDEIRSPNETEDLITVDPESLSKNSSVLLLGPITTPLSDGQLRLVINRITNELSKPEYLPLLDKIAKGGFGDSNFGLKKSIIPAPDSRRYIKPHRCNHQSKLARVYGGPKWLICTGYININTPSLYD